MTEESPQTSIGGALTYGAYRETRYFRALDGLRAVSILLVLVLHTNSALWARANGGLGVTIFFVISGYRITTLLLREESRRGTVSLRAFYVRRACRIFPLYYTVLAFYVVLVIGLNYHGHRARLLSALPYFLTYVNDLTPHLGSLPFAHSWSLGVEEKFYFVWPLLAFVVWRGRLAWRVGGAFALMFVPFVLHEYHALPFDVQLFGLTPLCYAYAAILVGCLLALVLHHPRGYAMLSRVACGIPAVVALLALIALHVFEGAREWMLFVYPFAVALVMISVLVGETPWTRALATRPAVFVGVRSYGIYLVHAMCLSVLAGLLAHAPGIVLDGQHRPIGPHRWEGTVALFMLGFAVSLVVASALNVTVERPFVSLGRRMTRRMTGAEPVAPPRLADPALEPVSSPLTQKTQRLVDAYPA